jgi:hypothetical protein
MLYAAPQFPDILTMAEQEEEEKKEEQDTASGSSGENEGDSEVQIGEFVHQMA